MKSVPRADRVGVRQLRQNLSVYLRRVKRGEALEVTERGHVVARLVPARDDESVLEGLIAEGKAAPAVDSLDDLPRFRGPVGDELSRALEEERAERL